MNNNLKLTLAEKFEFMGSIFWLLMDFCWFKEWRLITFILIPPTILANLLVIALGEKGTTYIVTYAALNFWVMANVLWVLGDLNEIKLFLIAADISFKFAIVFTGLVLFFSFKNKSLSLVLRLFRRFRVRP